MLLVSPSIVTHNEEANGSCLLHTVRYAFEPVIEPADLKVRQVHGRSRSKIDVAVFPASPSDVGPGTDDGSRTGACDLRHCFRGHRAIQQHIAVAVVVPSDYIQVRDRYVLDS